ncbi:hypothetical protein G6F46_015012 [Rhizopus delemar]|nr:hypothetical protein G6F46_015012 [Rhizopus delemar]
MGGVPPRIIQRRHRHGGHRHHRQQAQQQQPYRGPGPPDRAQPAHAPCPCSIRACNARSCAANWLNTCRSASTRAGQSGACPSSCATCSCGARATPSPSTAR